MMDFSLTKEELEEKLRALDATRDSFEPVGYLTPLWRRPAKAAGDGSMRSFAAMAFGAYWAIIDKWPRASAILAMTRGFFATATNA